MKSIGFAQEEINDIITVLAGIILIGDIVRMQLPLYIYNVMTLT